MNTKRNRRKIWHLIYSVLLALPLLILLVSFLIMIVQQKASNVDFGSYWSYDLVVENIFLTFDEVLGYFTTGWYDNSFMNDIYTFIESCVAFLGGEHLARDNYIFNYIMNYLSYVVVIEFLSLFINIILWLPRYFRDKLQESGD